MWFAQKLSSSFIDGDVFLRSTSKTDWPGNEDLGRPVLRLAKEFCSKAPLASRNITAEPLTCMPCVKELEPQGDQLDEMQTPGVLPDLATKLASDNIYCNGKSSVSVCQRKYLVSANHQATCSKTVDAK